VVSSIELEATAMPNGYLSARGSARSAHREQMRAAVVEAALRLFLERGHLDVRVDDIVEAVGISRATFYKYFSERDEILAELFAQLIDDDPPAVDAQGRVVDRIRAVLGATAARMVEQEELARFVYSVPLRHDALLPGRTGQPRVMQVVHDLVVEGVAAGELRGDVPAELLSHQLARSFEAAMRDWATGEVDDPTGHTARLLDVAIGGIRATD
jgi:AcrR family transcriptional regulator